MKYEHSIGLVIGIPTLYRPVTIEWALALRGQVPPINFNANMMIVPHQQVADARNQICEAAVAQKAKYVFFIGDDTEPPLHALKQLIFRAENTPDAGVIGGIYFTKSDPPSPLVFRGNGAGSYWDWKIGEFFECSGLGMDCTLIRTEILDYLPKPWFKTIDKDDFLDNRNYAEMWTEDLYFCKNILDNSKYKIYADASVIAKHWDSINHKCYSVPPNSLPTRRISKTKEKVLLDIGCGPIYREDDECEVVRLDIREEVNPDYRCDVRQIPFDNESADVVFSSHVLEHFGRREHEELLTEWLRVLKPGGEIRLILPSIKWAAKQIMDGVVDGHVLNVLYGAQDNPYDYHYNGFTPESVTVLLEKHKCKVEKVEEDDFYNMYIVARKE